MEKHKLQFDKSDFEVCFQLFMALVSMELFLLFPRSNLFLIKSPQIAFLSFSIPQPFHHSNFICQFLLLPPLMAARSG